MKTYIMFLLLTLSLVSMLRSAEDDGPPKIYVMMTTDGGMPLRALAGVAGLHNVPVAIESTDADWWRRANCEGMLLSLPFNALEPGTAIELLLTEIAAAIRIDAFTVSLLTNEPRHFGPPHAVFSRSVPSAILELSEAPLNAIAQSMSRPGETEISCLDMIHMKIPAFDQGISSAYLDILRSWSGDLRRERDRNVSWCLTPDWPSPRIQGVRQNILLSMIGFQGPVGAIIDTEWSGSRWVCAVSGLHPMLGALKLSQAMDESHVDFYVYSLPEAINKDDKDAWPRAPGVVFGGHGDGRVTSLLGWHLFSSGLATGDSLSKMLDDLKNTGTSTGAQIERITHSEGNEIRFNQSPDFFGATYVAIEHPADQSVKEFLTTTLRRNWPDITVKIVPCHPVIDEQRTVPALANVTTMRDMLVQLVPTGVKGTWAMIQDLDGAYSVSFRPMGALTALPAKESPDTRYEPPSFLSDEEAAGCPIRMIFGLISINNELAYEGIKRGLNFTNEDFISRVAKDQDVDRIVSHAIREVVRAISRNPYPEALPFFLSLRNHEREVVRVAVVQALGVMSASLAKPRLEEMLNDESPAVRDEVRRSLAGLAAEE